MVSKWTALSLIVTCALLTCVIVYDDTVIQKQRDLIRAMTRNKACMVDPTVMPPEKLKIREF